MPVFVHRDLGSGFTHHDSSDCPCEPHVIYDDDERPTPEIHKEIERKELKQ